VSQLTVLSRSHVLAAVLVLAGVFGLGLALGYATGSLRLPGWLTSSDDSPPGDALPPSRPTRIRIPSLDIEAKIHSVGLDEHGAIAAPSLRQADEAGWYEDGPSPGQYGPAVIVGHVDDTRGPAVFHRLGTVEPGTRVEITRRDRRVAIFEVTNVRSYDKTAIPADEVYGDFSRPGLRLITCGGRWLGGDTGYADNLVVFATLVAARE
jgi:Sortase domain